MLKTLWKPVVLIALSVGMTGCARFLTDKEMQSWDSVRKISQEAVVSKMTAKPAVRKVAIVGFFSPMSQRNDLIGAVDLATNRAGTALDAGYEVAPAMLRDLGFEVVDAKTVLANPVYKTVGSEPTLGWSHATGTRVRYGWDSDSLGSFVIGENNVSPEQLYQLIESLGVDGIVTGVFTPYDGKLQYAALNLFVKGEGNKAQRSWMAHIKPGAYGIEKGTNFFAGYGVPNREGDGAVIAGAFKLLAAKMATDLLP